MSWYSKMIVGAPNSHAPPTTFVKLIEPLMKKNMIWKALISNGSTTSTKTGLKQGVLKALVLSCCRKKPISQDTFEIIVRKIEYAQARYKQPER